MGTYQYFRFEIIENLKNISKQCFKSALPVDWFDLGKGSCLTLPKTNREAGNDPHTNSGAVVCVYVYIYIYIYIYIDIYIYIYIT